MLILNWLPSFNLSWGAAARVSMCNTYVIKMILHCWKEGKSVNEYRWRDEERWRKNTSNEDEQQEKSLELSHSWQVMAIKKMKCWTLALHICPAHNRLLDTYWHYCSSVWEILSGNCSQTGFPSAVARKQHGVSMVIYNVERVAEHVNGKGFKW